MIRDMCAYLYGILLRSPRRSAPAKEQYIYYTIPTKDTLKRSFLNRIIFDWICIDVEGKIDLKMNELDLWFPT